MRKAIQEIQEVALYVCGVIVSMSKELNFESRTWVMITGKNDVEGSYKNKLLVILLYYIE